MFLGNRDPQEAAATRRCHSTEGTTSLRVRSDECADCCGSSAPRQSAKNDTSPTPYNQLETENHKSISIDRILFRNNCRHRGQSTLRLVFVQLLTDVMWLLSQITGATAPVLSTNSYPVALLPTCARPQGLRPATPGPLQGQTPGGRRPAVLVCSYLPPVSNSHIPRRGGAALR